MTVVLLTVDETAERLRVHPQTVRRLQRANELGRQLVGNKVFIREEWVTAYLDRHANSQTDIDVAA